MSTPRMSVVLILLAISGGLLPALEENYYTTHVVPVLRNNCYECHGPTKAKAGLQLDSPRGIMLGGNEGPAVVAGHPDRSILFELVDLPADDPDIMPPKGGPLLDEEKEVLRQWIAAGAPFGDADADGKAKAFEVKPLPTLDLDALAKELKPIPEATLKRVREAGFKIFTLSQNGALVEVDGGQLRDKLDSKALAALKPIADRVIRLDLGGTSVDDADLSLLASLPRLQKLHLEKSSIGDAGLKHVGALTELRYLNLYATEVSDAGLKHLGGLQKLEKLYLWQSKATKAGAEKLQQQIPGLTVNLGD